MESSQEEGEDVDHRERSLRWKAAKRKGKMWITEREHSEDINVEVQPERRRRKIPSRNRGKKKTPPNIRNE